MNDDMQKRAITILSTGISYLLASRLADKIIDEPEERGVNWLFEENMRRSLARVEEQRRREEEGQEEEE